MSIERVLRTQSLIAASYVLLLASCEPSEREPDFASNAGHGGVQVARAALTTDGLVVRLAPNSPGLPATIAADGSTWADPASGITFTAGAGAARPSPILTGGLVTGLRFSGAQYMTAALGDTSAWTGFTAIAVFKTHDTLVSATSVFGSGGGSNRDNPTAGIDWGMRFGFFAPSGSRWHRLRPQETVVMTWKRSKTFPRWKVRKNGIATDVTTNDGSFPTGIFKAHLGAQSTLNGVPEAAVRMDLHELLIYKRELTQAEARAAELELGAPRGIAVSDGQITPSTEPWQTITAGSAHGCGLRGGRLYCWGDSDQGTVGDGKGELAERIRQIGRATDWTAVEAGYDHSCAIRRGQLYCWGVNASGKLGVAIGAQSENPVRVGTASDWTAVSAGNNHTCGIRAGQLWCWGEGGYGQLGTGSTANVATPTRIGGDSDWTLIRAAQYNTCGIRNGGQLYCWGWNNWGELGQGDKVFRSTPTRVGTESNYQDVAINRTTCAVRSGQLHCISPATFLLNRIGTLANWSAVAMGGYQTTCGIESGRLYCWPGNTAPQAVATEFTDWQAVTVLQHWTEDEYTCALRAGTRYCWGGNRRYPFGNGNDISTSVPTPIDDPIATAQPAQPWARDYLEFDATAGSMAADGSSWTDRWGGNVSFAPHEQAPRPTRVVANGKDALRFMRGQRVRASLGDANSWTGFTITAVFRTPPAVLPSQALVATGGGVTSADDPSLDVRWLFGASSTANSGLGGAGEGSTFIPFGTSNYAPNTTYVMSWTRGGPGSAWTVRKNGVVVNATPIPDALFPTSELHAYLGLDGEDLDYPPSNESPAHAFDLYYLRIYNRQVGPELGTIEDALGDTYGVNVPPPVLLTNGQGPCIKNGDCTAGLTCGFGVGPQFGKPANQGVCWNPGRCAHLARPDCGGAQTLCGNCCVPSCEVPGAADGCGGTCQLCVMGADSDRDTILDCDEQGDGTSWTNSLVFNGVETHQGDSCHAAPSCGAIDSFSEIEACFGAQESSLLSSGWDFATSDTNLCDPGFGFEPSWSDCREDFAALYDARVKLDHSGHHCFEVEGSVLPARVREHVIAAS